MPGINSDFVDWFELLAKETAEEALAMTTRLLALVGKGQHGLGKPRLLPFEIYANAAKVLDNDAELAGYAAQYGWDGVQQLVDLRAEYEKRLKIKEGS
jgi:hypothetical protein